MSIFVNKYPYLPYHTREEDPIIIKAGSFFRLVKMDSNNFILTPLETVEGVDEVYASPEMLKAGFSEVDLPQPEGK